MQVFVLPADLESPGAQVKILKYFPDGIAKAMGDGPDGTVLMYVPDQYCNILPTQPTYLSAAFPVLADNWRDAIGQTINAEANRRILLSFPDYMQRNASMQMLQNNMTMGMDSTQWPPSAQAQMAEAQRGWNWIALMRTTSDNLTNTNPLNPVDDSHWPAQLSPPIYIPTS